MCDVSDCPKNAPPRGYFYKHASIINSEKCRYFLHHRHLPILATLRACHMVLLCPGYYFSVCCTKAIIKPHAHATKRRSAYRRYELDSCSPRSKKQHRHPANRTATQLWRYSRQDDDLRFKERVRPVKRTPRVCSMMKKHTQHTQISGPVSSPGAPAVFVGTANDVAIVLLRIRQTTSIF